MHGDAALDLERIAAGRDSLVRGSVRVTTTEALADQLVVPAIAGLRRAHPELQLDLMVGVRSLDIARREADLAVKFARPPVSELICRKLGEVGFSLYASERYLAKVGGPEAWSGIGWLRSHYLHGRSRRCQSILHGRILGGRAHCAPLR